MSSTYLLRTGMAIGARTAPKLSAATPVGALCMAAFIYVAVRGQ